MYNPATLALAARGTALYQTRYGNVAPRVGFSYQFGANPDRITVLRGGFGIFYDMGEGSLGAASSYFPFCASQSIGPWSCSTGFIGVCFPLSAGQAASPKLTTSPPVFVIIVAAPDLKSPRTYEWNFALEKALGSSQSVSFTYIGAAGRDLLRVPQLNNPNPNFQVVWTRSAPGRKRRNQTSQASFGNWLGQHSGLVARWEGTAVQCDGCQDWRAFTLGSIAKRDEPSPDKGHLRTPKK